MDAQKELLDAVQILIDKADSYSTKILFGNASAVDTTTKRCTITILGNSYTLPFYGGEPTVGRKYPVFIPQRNMSIAFVIG